MLDRAVASHFCSAGLFAEHVPKRASCPPRPSSALGVGLTPRSLPATHEARAGPITSANSAYGFGGDLCDGFLRTEVLSPSGRHLPGFPLVSDGEMLHAGSYDVSQVCGGDEEAMRSVEGRTCREVLEEVVENVKMPRFMGPISRRRTGTGTGYAEPEKMGSPPPDFELAAEVPSDAMDIELANRPPIIKRETLPTWSTNEKDDRVSKLGTIKVRSWKHLKQESTRGGLDKSTTNLKPKNLESHRRAIIEDEVEGRRVWAESSEAARTAWEAQLKEEREREKPRAGKEAITKAYEASIEGMELKGTKRGSDRLKELIDDPPPFVIDPENLPLFHPRPIANLLTGSERFTLGQRHRLDHIVIADDPGRTFAGDFSGSCFNERGEAVTRFASIKPKDLQEQIRVEARSAARFREELEFPSPAPLPTEDADWEDEDEGEEQRKQSREARRQEWRSLSIAAMVSRVIASTNRSSRAGARRRRARSDGIRSRFYRDMAERFGILAMSPTIGPRPSLPDPSDPFTPPAPPLDPRPLAEASYSNISDKRRRGIILYVGEGGQAKKGEKLKGVHSADFGAGLWRGFGRWLKTGGYHTSNRRLGEGHTSQVCSVITCVDEKGRRTRVQEVKSRSGKVINRLRFCPRHLELFHRDHMAAETIKQDGEYVTLEGVGQFADYREQTAAGEEKGGKARKKDKGKGKAKGN